jgi:hypothetical protein
MQPLATDSYVVLYAVINLDSIPGGVIIRRKNVLVYAVLNKHFATDDIFFLFKRYQKRCCPRIRLLLCKDR